MENIKIKITKETIRKIEKTVHRVSLVESGFYVVPKHKVHKSSKDYSRKVKHKKNLLDY